MCILTVTYLQATIVTKEVLFNKSIEVNSSFYYLGYPTTFRYTTATHKLTLSNML